jgi:hypothetical protein
VHPAITKYDINRLRLRIIKGEIIDQYDTYNEFRRALFPTINLNTFRQWFKKPYYISDHRLCKMEQALGISEQVLCQHLNSEFDLPIEALCKAKGIRITL